MDGWLDKCERAQYPVHWQLINMFKKDERNALQPVMMMMMDLKVNNTLQRVTQLISSLLGKNNKYTASAANTLSVPNTK